MRISAEKIARQLDPSVAWLDEYLPRVLGAEWAVEDFALDGAMYGVRRGLYSMTVMVSGAVELDGKRWLHVSCARPDRLPSYEDLCEVKRLFVGRDRAALQVFAPEAQHVNNHPNCLHLWHCVDGDVTPDFTRGGGTI